MKLPGADDAFALENFQISVQHLGAIILHQENSTKSVRKHDKVYIFQLHVNI